MKDAYLMSKKNMNIKWRLLLNPRSLLHSSATFVVGNIVLRIFKNYLQVGLDSSIYFRVFLFEALIVVICSYANPGNKFYDTFRINLVFSLDYSKYTRIDTFLDCSIIFSHDILRR